MNILLTGGAGYIGSHTAWALKRAGFTPVVLDSLVTGHEAAVKFGPFIKGDIGDADLVRRVCMEHSPVAVVHFAAFIEVGESVAHPEKYHENNTRKAKILFDTAHDAGITAAVFSSTAAVYGTPANDQPIHEDHPLKPINPYGESKLATETYIRTLDGAGLRSVSLRYFNAAGAAPQDQELGEAHKPETHLVPNAILAGLGLRDPLSLFGNDYPTPDGTAIRDYVHVMDLAEAHVAALRYLLDGGTTDVCNLGTGQGYSVKQVIEAVNAALGKDAPYTIAPRRPGDPPRLVADATRARSLLGWTPQETLESIVRSAWAWHRTEEYRKRVK